MLNAITDTDTSTEDNTAIICHRSKLTKTLFITLSVKVLYNAAKIYHNWNQKCTMVVPVRYFYSCTYLN